MRVVIQSKHSLVIETRGQSLLALLAVAVPLHGLLIYSNIVNLYAYSHSWIASFVLGIFVLAYSLLAILSFGPLADRHTVTFQGLKSLVTIEHLWFGNWKIEKTLRFEDFEKFEISPPEQRGFCRIRFSDGKTRRLFRIRPGDDFSVIQRLEEITSKKTEMIP